VTEYVYAWRNNDRRAALYGRRCRIVASGSLGTVLVVFENGERVTTSRRALRRAGTDAPRADAGRGAGMAGPAGGGAQGPEPAPDVEANREAGSGPP
jgi:hypothetical protein